MPEASADIVPQELAALIESGDRESAVAFLRVLDSSDELLAVSRLSDETRAKLLAMLEAEEAASLLQVLPEPQVIDAVERLDPQVAAEIVSELPSAEQADVLGELDETGAHAIIELLDQEDAADVRRLVEYEDDVAGGLMVTEFLAYDQHASVAHVITDLGENAEKYSDYDIQYTYVTDRLGALVGVLRLRDLLLSPRSRELRAIMIREPISVPDAMHLEDLARFFDDNRFFGAPVVDEQARLVGVVQRTAVEEALAEGSDDTFRRSQGIVGGEELRTMPLLLRSRRRLSWLSVNILLNIIAASVIALHQDTLEAVIALAVFLPIISDMSGCSGNQAVAVSMRELTLGVIKPTELLRTLYKEVTLGFINGAVLGGLIGLVALVWQGNAYLGLVVGGALMLNTIVAVCIGGSVPLLLKRLKVDPALAAGPILTTITDMCGFFIVLTFASMMLERLV
ncbi:MAG: magnesium transporter [Planctomycetota bacterium]